MKYYEILYIVNPNLEQARLQEVKKEVTAEVNKLPEAEIINHRLFGKKRLAYPVEKHKYGTYILLHLAAGDQVPIAELGTFLKLHKTIIRHLIVRLEERPEPDLSPEIDDLEAEEAAEEAPEAAATEPGVEEEEEPESAKPEETPAEAEPEAPAETEPDTSPEEEQPEAES